MDRSERDDPPRDAERHPPERPEAVEVEAVGPAAAEPASVALEEAGGRGAPWRGGGARELARAFQANAEALRGMHEIQARLAEALKRGDRSELVLSSTNALNETFRNLAAIQRQMLTQMQEQDAARRRNPLVPLMLLGLLVVLLGGVYLIVDQLQQARPSMQELAGVRDENERGRLEAYRAGQARGAEETSAKAKMLQEELDQGRTRILALEGERDTAKEDVEQLERAKRAVETERDDLAERVIRSQNEAMARKLVEDEAREQKAELIVAKRRLEALEADLAKARAERERYLKQLAAYGFGLPADDPGIEVRYPDREGERAAPSGTGDAAGGVPPVGPGATGSDPEPRVLEERPELPGGGPPDAAPAPAPSAAASRPGGLPPPKVQRPGAPDGSPTAPFPPPTPAAGTGTKPLPAKPVPVGWRRELNRDPALAGRIRGILNRLLGGSAPSTASKSEWQVTRIGGVARDLLAEVLLLQYDPSGRLLGRIEAEQLRIVADREKNVVSFLLKSGTREFRGRTEKLPAEGARLVVGEGREQVRIWAGSQLVMVRSK